jgi:hypothetical protein
MAPSVRPPSENAFENDIQSKRNDALDSAVGFGASFGFFAVLLIIGVAIKFLSL